MLFSFTDTTEAVAEPGVAAPAGFFQRLSSSLARAVASPEDDPFVDPDQDAEQAPVEESTDASETLEVRLAYESFDLAYGGVWSERLQVLAYPACFATTPEVAECATGVPVEFDNDVDAQTVTFATMDEAALQGALLSADLPDASSSDTDGNESEGGEIPGGSESSDPVAPSDPASPSGSADPSELPNTSSSDSGPRTSAGSVSSAVFRPAAGSMPATVSDTVTVAEASSGGVVYSVGGSGGNYAATPLAPSMGWQVGVGSGDFTYDYDFTLPKANAGVTPSLGLNYSSGGVDAMSLAENGQADSAGIGWSLGTSYVARKYGSCADDGWSAKGDLCWNTRNGRVVDDFTIVLNGKSSTLVRINDSNQFRLRQDPTWQVELRTGAGNGDNDGEHFVVTDTDGTQYFFGGNPDAAQTVPVYGDDAGEPCYGTASTAAGQRWCQQAYQWNLQRAVDVHGNKIVYSYEEETNHYARWGNTTNTVAYESSAALAKIEYGFSSTGVAHQVVNIVTGKRCTKELTGGTCEAADNPVAKPHLWPDVPSDLICNAGQTCLVGSPTFFSTKRYSRVVTRTVDGNGNAPTTRTVDTYTLEHTMPDPDGTGPDQADLWLSQVGRTGSSGSGTGDLASPPVRFFGTELRNRVVASGGERTLRKFRIGGVRNETGGKIDVVYGHAENRACDAAYVTGRDRWNTTRECFAQKYAPPGGTPKWEWFHKYVVTRVALGDVALGYQLGSGSNTDLGTLRIYDYEYSGAPAWRFLDSRHLPTADETWNDWRGYAETRTRTRATNSTNSGVSGAADVSVTRTVQFRGMNQSLPAPGQPLINNSRINTSEISVDSDEQFDEAWLAGMVAESETRTGDDKLISRTYRVYDDAVTAKDPYGISARVVYEQLTRVRTPISGASHFVTETTRTIDKGSNSFNNNFGVGVGTVTKTQTISKTEGAASVDYKTCTETGWTTNNTTRVRRPSQVTTYGHYCGNASSANMLGLVKNFYDNNQGTAAPGAVSKGLLTSTRTHLDEAGTRFVGTRTTYDAWGRPLTQTVGITENNATGSTTTTDYNPHGGAAIDDDLLTQVRTTGPTGYTTLTKLDPRRGLPTELVDLNDNTTVLGYDPLGRLTDVQMPNHHGTNKQSIKYSYTDNMAAPGRVRTQIRFDDTPTGEGRFEETYTFYDGWGRPIETQVPHPAADQPRKRIVSITGYDEQGLVYATAPAETNEVPTTVSQSPFDAVLNPKLDDLYSWTQNTYDAAGRVTRSQDLTRSSGVAVGVRSTDTTYTGDTIVVTPPVGAGPTRTTLDAGGQPEKIELGNTAGAWVDTASYDYTNLGQLARVTKVLGNMASNWTWSYDWLGRTTQAVDPDTGTTNTVYLTMSGDKPTAVQVTNPDGITKTTYDKLGRPTQRQTGANVSSLETVATWAYDNAITDGYGQLSRVTATAPTGAPDAGAKFVTTYDAYNKLGNPTSITQSYPAAWTGQAPVSSSASGLSGMVDVPITYTYDQAGDPKTITHPAINGPAGSLMPKTTITHTKVPETGAPASITAQLGDATNTAVLATYGYTNIGQIKTLTSAAPDPVGSTTAATFQRAYTYDTEHGRTNSITATIDPDGNGGLLPQTRHKLNYTYDRNDNPTQILRTATTTQGGVSTTTSGRSCFTYDGLNRLSTAIERVMGGTNAPSCTGSTGTGITTVYDYAYTYEATGDRLTAITSKVDTTPQTATYAYGVTSTPHRLTGIINPAISPTPLLPNPTTQTWNDAGRVTTATPPGGTQTSYGYDHQGRLATTTRGDLVVGNVYDTDGLRISRTTTKEGASPKRVIYLAGGLELTATGATGNVSLTNARRDHGTPEGIPLGSQDNATMTWVLVDTQNTTRLTATTNAGTGTNGNGGTVTAHDYTPYGDPVNTTATPPAPAPTTPGARGYLNKPHDPHGDIRLDHRTYNPSTATFTSPDPILITTDPLNLNPYTYARHNPLGMADPSGLCPAEVCGAPSQGGGDYGRGESTRNYGLDYPTTDESGGGAPATSQSSCLPFASCEEKAAWNLQLGHDEWVALQVGSSFCDGGVCEHAGTYEMWLRQFARPHGNALERAAFYEWVWYLEGGGLRPSAVVDVFLAAVTLGAGSVPAGLRAGGLRLFGKSPAANGVAKTCRTNSFTGDTLVLMADGRKKPIKDVKLGDKVIATDPETGETGPRKVVDLIRHGGLHTMVAVRLSDGTTIDATDRHPFWVESRGEWVDAIDLQPGDVVVAADGGRIAVSRVGVSEQDLTAYNLTVAGLHTYHVSASEVLVHNCKWPVPTQDNCAACAREIQDMIGGDIVHVRPTGGPRMGPSTNNPAGNWAEHYVVVRDGRVYDGFTGPSGLSIRDYKAQFEYADDINFGF